MTPQELFETGRLDHRFVHGGDVGIDEKGHLWVRAGAELRSDLTPQAHHLSKKPPPSNGREYTILTSGRMTALNPRHRSEPVWKHVRQLDSGSIDAEWIAVR